MSLDKIAKKRQGEMKASMSVPKGKSKGPGSQAGKNADAFKGAAAIKQGQSKLPKSDKARGVANSGKGQGSSPAAKLAKKKV